MNPIKARILYGLISILVAWCMAWTAGGTFSAGAGGGGTTCSGNYGETAEGSSNSIASGYTRIQRTAFDCVADANDATFHIYLRDCNTDAREIVFLIYADNEGEPGAKLWESDPHYWEDSTTVGWKTETIPVDLSGSYVWIGYHLESGSSKYYYTSQTPARTTRTIVNNGTFPDVDESWDTANDTASEYGHSCYISVP